MHSSGLELCAGLALLEGCSKTLAQVGRDASEVLELKLDDLGLGDGSHVPREVLRLRW